MYSSKLTKAEEEYCHSNITHKCHAHPKLMVSASFLFSVLLTVGFSWIVLAPCDSAFILALLAILLGIACFVWFLAPCNCSSVPLLSAEMRRSFMQVDQSHNLLVNAICEGRLRLKNTPFGVLMLTLLLSTCSLVCGEFVPYNFQFLVIVIPGIVCMRMNLIALTQSNPMRAISRAKIEKLAVAEANSPQELQEQIAFNMYIGNFDKADMCSKKLLLFAEQA